MNAKVLSFLLASCLVALVVWAVYRGNDAAFTYPDRVLPTAQAGRRNLDVQEPALEKYRETTIPRISLGIVT